MVIGAQHILVHRGSARLAWLETFEAAPGDVIGIIGRSGCGKTTLLETLAGMRDAGPQADFTVDGEAVDSWRGLSYRTLQSFPLFHWCRAAEHLELAARQRGSSSELAAFALQRMRALHLADKFPHQMSGGERARVTLAIAWALQSRILLLDEPFNGLDPISKRDFVEDLIQNFRQLGTVVFFVSHVMEDIVTLSTRCLAFTREGLREVQEISRPKLLEVLG